MSVEDFQALPESRRRPGASRGPGQYSWSWMPAFAGATMIAIALCSFVRAEPGSDDLWPSVSIVPRHGPSTAGVPIKVQYAQYTPSESDAGFIRLLGGRFSGDDLRTWLLPLREKIRRDFYKDVDDATLARGALAGDSGEGNPIYAAMKGMVAALPDTHSSVRNPQEDAEFERMMQGGRTSFGFVFATDRQGNAVVRGVLGGGPADRAGLRVGDRISGQQSAGWLILNVQRPSDGSRFAVRIPQKEVTMPDVASHLFGDKKIGYVYVQHFADKSESDTAQNFYLLVKSLDPRALNGLIVDLRDDLGGEEQTCLRMAGLFLPGRSVLAYTQRKGEGVRPWNLDRTGEWGDGIPRVAVLVNKFSASCSEIFAAALQDYRRAVVMGSCSYGKGSVQVVYPPQEGVRVTLTTAAWVRATGQSVEGRGVCPDSGYAVGSDETPANLSARAESRVYGDTCLRYEDPVIRRALQYFGVGGYGDSACQ